MIPSQSPLALNERDLQEIVPSQALPDSLYRLM